MQYFKGSGEIKLIVLIKEKNLIKSSLDNWYTKNFEKFTKLKEENILFIGLPYLKDKAPINKLVKPFLDGELFPLLDELNNPDVFVADSTYFKYITKQKKFDLLVGSGYESPLCDGTFYPVPNYSAYYYNDKIVDNIVYAISNYGRGITGILSSEALNNLITCPRTYTDIKLALESIAESKEKVWVDIETFSLDFWEAGIATIAITLEDETTYSFACDAIADPDTGLCQYAPNNKIRKLLKNFFDTCGTVCFHRATFDIKIVTYVLYMEEDFFNWDGLKESILNFKPKLDDSQLMVYLAHNSTSRIELGLKPNAAKYLGDYGLDGLDDITKIPLDDLLIYNACDTIATRYVNKRDYPKMVADNQLPIYKDLMIPSVFVIIQMELVGIPIDIQQTIKIQNQLQGIREAAVRRLNETQTVKYLLKILRQQESDKTHAKWAKKTAPIGHFDYVKYNPNSGTQNQILLYEVMELPILETTETGAPSTKKKVLEHLLNHTTKEEDLVILEALIDLAEVNILLNNFISTFLNKSIKKPDGWYYLHGSFNLGGTVSGRLSSSNPNMQNLPSGGNPYSKLVKSCIKAPPGALFVGADFWSLEDRISALTTKDPEKIKVYTDGYDGHCLRAYAYFSEMMPDIDPNSVDSINSIEIIYPDYRQDSKAPTFALTYQGTSYTLQINLGWSKDKADTIEQRFQKLYHVSIEVIEGKIKEASINGYVECAFGLRVRTPALKNCVYNASTMPYKAKKEKRTAGNALGQSYGLLNNRAGVELQERMLATDDAHRYILPSAHIHDAQYFICHPNYEVIRWLNDNINECMAWQDLPEIRHPDVKLGGDLDIFYPDWSKAVTLKYKDSAETIETKLNKHKDSLK